ncbi:hypothetical protein Fmac_009409 [Flemingia macrophylla]|uniref:Uncharacterized protein n=1 Tax=Flemingia macrophylla TaxID=520843 RepID=A0ABD1N085_9FABA
MVAGVLLSNLWNLKEIDLWGSMHLTDIPDLSKATKLVLVNLGFCRRISCLSRTSTILKIASLDNCKNLVSLPSFHLPWIGECRLSHFVGDRDVSTLLQQLLGPNLYDRDSKYFVFPGNHVIDECEFQTIGPSMIIPASCLNISYLCGFIYCIIFPKKFPRILCRGIYSTLDEVGMSVPIYEDDTQLWHTRSPPVRRSPLEFERSDHVIFGYHDLIKFDGMTVPRARPSPTLTAAHCGQRDGRGEAAAAADVIEHLEPDGVGAGGGGFGPLPCALPPPPPSTISATAASLRALCHARHLPSHPLPTICLCRLPSHPLPPICLRRLP